MWNVTEASLGRTAPPTVEELQGKFVRQTKQPVSGLRKRKQSSAGAALFVLRGCALLIIHQTVRNALNMNTAPAYVEGDSVLLQDTIGAIKAGVTV